MQTPTNQAAAGTAPAPCEACRDKGWNVFANHGFNVIEKCDSCERFTCDSDAVEAVALQAEAASDLLAALEYFAGFAPDHKGRADDDCVEISVTVGALREAAEAVAKAKGGAA